jgi:predicted GNAT superfamily acetyltransferase
MNPRWRLCDHTAPGWHAEVDALYARLGPAGPRPLPVYFVKTTFVRMGGLLATLSDGAHLLAVGLLFPRDAEAGRPTYTLRMHPLGPLPATPELLASLEALVAPGRVVLHAIAGAAAPARSDSAVGGFSLGAPDSDELPAIRRLYGAIWGVPDHEAYPDDLHSPSFAPGTSLAARRDGQLAGFLLGFRRFALPALAGLGLPYRLDLAIESQVMGVAPAFRRFGLAATLKREQARQALAGGLDLIHWTADPLQFPNAVLNFGKLRAVAGEFTRAYYPFQNALNRVPASRLGIAWLPRSARGRAGMADAPAERGLGRFPGVAVLNDGPRISAEPGDAPHLALEIPADWTALQHDDTTRAAAWRDATDSLLERYLGYAPGRYVVGDAAAEAGRHYLVAHRYAPELLL